MTSKFKSIVEWPEEVKCGKIPNTSEDVHSSEAEARHVCSRLWLAGLGLEGKFFPISVRVEPLSASTGE